DRCPGDYGPGLVRDCAGKTRGSLAIQKRADGKYQRTENYQQRLLGQHQKSPMRSLIEWRLGHGFPHEIQIPIDYVTIPAHQVHIQDFCARSIKHRGWLVLVVVADNCQLELRFQPKIRCAERYCHSPSSVNRNCHDAIGLTTAAACQFAASSRVSAWSVVMKVAPRACSSVTARFPSSEFRVSIASRTTETRRPRS